MEDKYLIESSTSESGEDSNLQDIRKPSLLQVGVLYSISVLLLLFGGSRVQRADFYPGILITEFVLILLPALAFMVIYRYDMKRVLRLNRLDAAGIALVIGIMASALPLVGVLNGINLLIIKSIFGKVVLNQPPIGESMGHLALGILIIGASAGICEEVLFRGVIQRGFESFGEVKAIFAASLLFGLMHVDFQRFLGTFLLGAIIGFIVYRTNSLYAGMVAHFTNNSIAVVLLYLSNWMTRVMESKGLNGTGGTSGNIDMSIFTSLPREQKIVVIVVWAIIGLTILAVFGGIFWLLMHLFLKRTANVAKRQSFIKQAASAKDYLGFVPGIAAVAFIYFAQAIKMKGITIEAVENILGIMGMK